MCLLCNVYEVIQEIYEVYVYQLIIIRDNINHLYFDYLYQLL